MSTRGSNNMNSKTKEELSPPLLYCPQYIAWDKEVREETKARFRAFCTERRTLLIQYIDTTLHKLRDPVLRLQFNHPPVYKDNDIITQAACTRMDTQIDKWNGVQFSRQFIKELNETRKTMDKPMFTRVAKNYYDQTAWKVTGEYFFAPYLSEANRYFHRYCQCITNVSDDERDAIYRFACIVYIITILTAKIKGYGTKCRPLIRQKTMMKSIFIHVELERLCPALKVRKGRNDCHKDLVDCCSTLYREQEQKVYNMCGVSMEGVESKTDADQNKNDPCELPKTRKIRWSKNRNARLKKNRKKSGDNTLTQKWHQGKVCKHVAFRCNKHKRRQCALIHVDVNTVRVPCEWERKCGFCHNHRQCIFAMHKIRANRITKHPQFDEALNRTNDRENTVTTHVQSEEDNTITQKWYQGKVCKHVAFRCNKHKRRQCALIHANVNTVQVLCEWERKCGFCHNHRQCIFAMHSPIKPPSVANADPIVPMTQHPQSKENKTLIQRWYRGKVCDHVAFRCNTNRRRQCTLFHANVNSIHL
eukprot:283866_1